MTQKTSKVLSVTLWVLQTLLAAGFVFGGVMKLFKPIEKLSLMWPWTGELSPLFVRCMGVVDLLGAIGLILPTLLRIRPVLTSIAAVGCFMLMIAAGIFHIARGEASQIGINIFFAVLAALIAWGRFMK